MNFSPASMSKTDSLCLNDRSADLCQVQTPLMDGVGQDASAEVRQAFQAMRRALVLWDLHGTFDCGADYTLARAKWLRLQRGSN